MWGTGSGRMATLLFVKDWACLAASLWPREIWGEKHHLCSCSGNKNQKVKKKSVHLVLGCRLIKCLNWRHPLSESWVEQQVYKLHISTATLTNFQPVCEMGYVGAAVTVLQAVNVYVFSISFPSFELICICSWFSHYSSILLLWIIPELPQVYPSYFTWCVHDKMRVCLKKLSTWVSVQLPLTSSGWDQTWSEHHNNG